MGNSVCIISTVFFIFFIFFDSVAAAQNVGPVRNLKSASHIPDLPSRNSRIEMTWEFPEGDPYGYFYLFDTDPDHTFDVLNSLSVPYTTARHAASSDLAEFSPDDTSYYFHIAAVDGEDEIGPTVSAGPFRIDVVPPSGASVTAPKITTSRTVTVTLKAFGASKVYLSNEGYELGGLWEDFADSKNWKLIQGGGEKTIYVRFRDLALNTSDASASVFYILGDVDGNGTVGLQDAVSVLQLLNGINTDEINPDADSAGDGTVGLEDAVFILRRICEN